jgi:hypothetical protein
MSQLLTLIWLKWRLLRNSLRSSKAVVNKIASILGMLITLVLAAVLALILGVVAFALTQPGAMGNVFRQAAAPESANASVEFIFFSILGLLYLMWATVPLSIGGNKQFDAGKLLLYPITLRKLFAVDFISELTTLHSVFAIPAVLAISIGAGLGSGHLGAALLTAIPTMLFGVGLSKWLSATLGSLVRRKRGKGETVLALLGAVTGLGAAVAGQIAPILFRHAESFRALRWTPPGAAAFLLVTDPAEDPVTFVAAFLVLSAYAVVLIAATYWIARRAALGLEGRRKRKAAVVESAAAYSGWQLPFISSDLSAVVEKELRYVMRNAQVRMMTLMPLIIILIRFVNSRRMGGLHSGNGAFLTYGAGFFSVGGILYVFLILGPLSSNLFAFEEGGMRTIILSPIDRRKILLGKNISLTLVALAFSLVTLILNAIVFGDLDPATLLFISLSFIAFAAISFSVGNWLSIRFPKRMRFGKRLNASGVSGLLLIPLLFLLATPPLAATLVGYLSQSLVYEYLTLLVLALLSIATYFIVINFHGRLLEKHELAILEAVREPLDE